MAKVKLGILTGGGDCPGLNAVLRAVVFSASNLLNAEVYGFYDGYLGLTSNHHRMLNRQSVEGIITLGGTILGTSNRFNPFSVAREGDFIDMSDICFENYQKLNLNALICVGGDGTLSIAHKLSKKGINVIGVPKTIDNDIVKTDMTFGFNSAYTTAAESIDKIYTTAASHHRVMLVEVMGRSAGWIALYAGMAGGADVILLPEIGFRYKNIVSAIEKNATLGKRFSIIVVAEGTREYGKDPIYTEHNLGDSVIKRLGGVSHKISKELEKKAGYECRVTVLGHIQRGGVPTPFDRVLASRFGCEAIKLVKEGNFNMMVSLKNNRIMSVPLADVSDRQKLIPKDGEIIKEAKNIGISFGD